MHCENEGSNERTAHGNVGQKLIIIKASEVAIDLSASTNLGLEDQRHREDH